MVVVALEFMVVVLAVVGGGAVMVFVAVMEAPPLECEDSGWCSCKTKLLKRLKNKIESVELQWGGGDTER